MPIFCKLTIEAAHNRRVQAGLEKNENLWTDEAGYAVMPYGLNDYIKATIEADFGAYDMRGIDYVAELLECLPVDIYCAYIED
jgi:hypothetical protein